MAGRACGPAAAPEPKPDPDGPKDLKTYLDSLEEWAQANKKDARNDGWAFWSLKLPAIVASASAIIWVKFNLSTVSVIAGVIASICVLIDGIHPRGTLRNVHLRAYHDIRMLMNSVNARYAASSAQPENALRRAIRDAEVERVRIATYIRDAETALRSN